MFFSHSHHSCVHSDLEQLRKIRRRSPHDDTEAFTVFLRSDVEAKSVPLPLVLVDTQLFLNTHFSILCFLSFTYLFLFLFNC